MVFINRIILEEMFIIIIIIVIIDFIKKGWMRERLVRMRSCKQLAEEWSWESFPPDLHGILAYRTGVFASCVSSVAFRLVARLNGKPSVSNHVFTLRWYTVLILGNPQVIGFHSTEKKKAVYAGRNPSPDTRAFVPEWEKGRAEHCSLDAINDTVSLFTARYLLEIFSSNRWGKGIRRTEREEQ